MGIAVMASMHIFQSATFTMTVAWQIPMANIHKFQLKQFKNDLPEKDFYM